jgi:hypothetical protein
VLVVGPPGHQDEGGHGWEQQKEDHPGHEDERVASCGVGQRSWPLQLLGVRRRDHHTATYVPVFALGETPIIDV